jgi:chromosome segregation ATPase
VCRALIRFLDDTQYWKGFQTAPLLCLDHLGKCLSLETYGKGFERFLNDQSAKLNELLNDLVRLEATGTRGESKRTALDWLADFAGSSATVAEATLTSTKADTPAEIFAQGNEDGSAGSIRDPEALLFENEKLSRKVRGLTQRLNELETRAASLQYRVATLTEDNKRLEMGYTGASTQARGLEKLVRDLTEQIRRLEDRNGDYRPKAVS